MALHIKWTFAIVAAVYDRRWCRQFQRIPAVIDRRYSSEGRASKEDKTMIHIKVQYDAQNRTFKLVDGGLGSLLEDYALYDLAIRCHSNQPKNLIASFQSRPLWLMREWFIRGCAE